MKERKIGKQQELAIYAFANILPLAITQGKVMWHKWSAHGKTMIKWSLHDLLLKVWRRGITL